MISWGVPQGSCLSLLLNMIYSLELITIIKQCHLEAHCFANN